MAAIPQTWGAGSRSFPQADATREAVFASLSRELRFCLDRGGYLTYIDGAWHEVLGHEPDALAGAHWQTLVATLDHAPMRGAIETAMASNTAQAELDLRMHTAGGSPRFVHWTVVPGPGDDAIAAIGYERTAQQRATLEARADAARLERRVVELESEVSELDEHSRAMEGFAAIAAHQLSEPLIVAESGSIMVAEDLGDALDPELRARLDAIGRGAARARQMIDGLLMDARAATGIELQPVSVDRVVGQVLDDLAPRFDERGVVAHVESLPAVRAEPRLVGVVYQNLLSNALKYGPRGGGVIHVGSEPHEDGWRLTVTSGGAPISEADRTRIFEPFRRRAGERRAPGSGLGLAICARLVDRMGGTIGVEPRPDGNAFYFVLQSA